MIASLIPRTFSPGRRGSETRKQKAPSRRVSLLSTAPRSRRGRVRPLIGFLSLLLILASSLGAAGTVSALRTHKQVSFTNSTSWTIEPAVVMKEEINCGSDGWIFSAWWTLPPGERRRVMYGSDSEVRRQASYPSETYRLTFRYEGERVELVQRELLRMIAPPAVGAPPEHGKSGGTWIELQDQRGQTIAHRVLHDPFERFAEHHSPGGRIELVERPLGRGEFDVLVPALPEAVTVSVWSSPLRGKRQSDVAREIAKFALRDVSDIDKEAGS